MADLKLSYASFKAFMGTLPVYYISGADGSYKIFCFPPGGDVNYSVVATPSDVTDFEANIKPTATSVDSQNAARAANNAATGGGSMPPPPAPTVAVTTVVAASTTYVSIFAANENRRGATIFNESTQTLFLKFDQGMSASSALKVKASGYYEVPFAYKGAIDGKWQNAIGEAWVTEMT